MNMEVIHMHEINHQLNQLPRAVRLDVEAHAGHRTAMTPVELVAHYRAIAQSLIEQKRSRYQPLPPGDEMARTIFDMLQGNDLSFIGGSAHQPFPRWVTHQIIKFLQVFINNLTPLQNRFEHEARQLALQAAAEVARLEGQRRAEDAERRRIQEDAANQLAQQQAGDAIRLAAEQAARQLAAQQAEAAAQALAEREADEMALYEARLALELVTEVAAQPVDVAMKPDGALISPVVHEKLPVHGIQFVPGPAAMAEIDRATLLLKHSIDAAVNQYVAAISPYLSTPKSITSAAY
jgi:hypothetical protein